MSLLLPDKHLAVHQSLVAQAAKLEADLPEVVSFARAWARGKELIPNLSIDRFILLLDVLAALNVIDLDGDLLVKVDSSASET